MNDTQKQWDTDGAQMKKDIRDMIILVQTSKARTDKMPEDIFGDSTADLDYAWQGLKESLLDAIDAIEEIDYQLNGKDTSSLTDYHD